MGYQKLFPEIVKKTYSNCNNISTKNIPYTSIKLGLLSKGKTISLPFLDIVNIFKINEEDIPKSQNLEIRLSEFNKDFSKLKKKILSFGFSENPMKAHIISELTNEEDFWKRFHKHTRNDIRKAKKCGLKLKRIENIKDLRKFYSLYTKEMKNFGTPQHSFNFFRNCFEILKRDFFGLNCYKDKKLISSIILFVEEDYGYVSFNVSNPNFRNLRPNDIIYWEMIKWSIKNKIKYLDVGQVDLNPEKDSREEGLLKFKRKWLGKEYKKIYFTRGFSYDSSRRNSLKKFKKVWRYLPSLIIKLIGPWVTSHFVY
jgi:lipid II:glycine glycyltransferase (peptidoglycan interpeptide bridge formation enzyme)